jgi:hypothetical protein
VGYARTGEIDRAGNDFSTLLAGQTWHQVLAAVHGFWQAVERVAFAEKIRAHGHTDIDRYCRLCDQLQHETDKVGGFFTASTTSQVAKTKQFFKLVHEQKQIGVQLIENRSHCGQHRL